MKSDPSAENKTQLINNTQNKKKKLIFLCKCFVNFISY